MWAFESLPEHDTALTQVLQGSEPFLPYLSLLAHSPHFCPRSTLTPTRPRQSVPLPPFTKAANFSQLSKSKPYPKMRPQKIPEN